MSSKTKIEWTRGDDGTPGSTWNPVRGCSRISPGCVNCYAERQAARFNSPGTPQASIGSVNPCAGGSKPGPFHGFVTKVNGHPQWTGKMALVENHLLDPLKWKDPRRIFVNSMSDLFHENLPYEAIDRVFAVMALCPQHTFQVLTKRADRLLAYLKNLHPGSERVMAIRTKCPDYIAFAQDKTSPFSFPLDNVWLGVSVENQEYADKRIPLLLQTPAAVRFVSYEPALGPVDFAKYLDGHEDHGVDLSRPIGSKVGACVGWTPPLDWIIVGGESGPGARPFDVAWARKTIEQCKGYDVKCFVKQLGADPHIGIDHLPGESMGCLTFTDQSGHRGPLKDRKGGDMDEWPSDIRVREYPEVSCSR